MIVDFTVFLPAFAATLLFLNIRSRFAYENRDLRALTKESQRRIM